MVRAAVAFAGGGGTGAWPGPEKTGTRRKGRCFFETGDTSLTPHALWAYPLAGVSCLAIDIPLSLVVTVPVAMGLSFCELGLTLRDGVYDVARQQAPVVAEGK